ncbi:MAG: porin, partial [Thermodesulfobacteriota bacterium]
MILIRSLILLLAIFMTLPAYSNFANAQNMEESVAKSKQQYQIDLEELKKQMKALEQQIKMLETQNEEVNQKLYDAMSPEKAAWTDKFEAGYKKGLYFKSKDGNWKMKFRIRGQFQASVVDPSDGITSTNFSVARLRFKWNGNAFRPWFLYTVQLGARDSVTLRDLYFDLAYNKRAAPRVGQYKVPFGRQELTSSSTLQFVTRSIVNAEFGYGRDRGVGMNGVAGQNFAYGAGVFNGAGRNGRSENSNVLWAGRTQFMWSNGGK